MTELSGDSYLTHLECSACGRQLAADRLYNLCPDCQKPLLARYDLAAVQQVVTPALIAGRQSNLWRYREVLPVRRPEFSFSLGEGWTPLIRADRLGQELNFDYLLLKDEGSNPTGSFKARGMAVAVGRACELGATAFSVPSAGNAAGALCAYAALAGIPAHVFLPADVPAPFVTECRVLGAALRLVDGLISDAGRIAAAELERFGRFDMSTLREPYRLEGKKTMGYEIAEQLNWRLPDVIIYPTGGGTGLIGMWKAFAEMEELGWIDSRRPRMVCVQSAGCAPIVKAFHAGRNQADFWPNARTIADGLRVPGALGDFLILRALRDSAGTAVAVSDEEILAAVKLIGRTQGLFVSPEAAAPLAAFRSLQRQGWVRSGESVVLFITGNGLKYTHLWS
ncbi:MAG: threonine synthase [Candidatus Neomarinimicrobiota bacterium]